MINKMINFSKTILLGSFILFFLTGCILNNPYRASERGKNFFYTNFSEPPKHLDPAISYSSNEYALIGQIYEPPLQYHYLNRPYELIPSTLEELPVPQYYDRDGNRLPQDVSPEKVHRTVYELRIKKGIFYQKHPAFAKDSEEKFIYHNLEEKDVKGIMQIKDFPLTGTRELVSDD